MVGRDLDVNGIRLHVVEAGAGTPVVLLHGFPETSFSWRHQLPALAAAGFHAFAPDLRGFGASAKPPDPEAYALTELVGDVVGLLDALGLERAHLVGHDWGSIILWSTALTHPDRVDRLVSLNVPYRGHCNSFPSIAFLREHHPERFGYVLMFQEEGAAEAGFAADPDRWLQAFYFGAARDRGFLSDEEFAVYRNAFVAGGITGPVNLYRNIDRNVEAYAPYAGARIDHPTLMIAADSDPVLPAALTEGLDEWLGDVRVEVVPDCGHWTQQERPELVNELMIDFLR